MVSALGSTATSPLTPDFPFLSVLASGGHTLLIHSSSLTDHRVLGTTNDIAIGELLDKAARLVLPLELLQTTKNTMYGALLEKFAFVQGEHKSIPVDSNEHGSSQTTTPHGTLPSGATGCSAKDYLDTFGNSYGYQVPANHEDAARKSMTEWGWGFEQPLSRVHGGTKINSMELSFSGLLTSAERVVRFQTDPLTRKRTNVERDIEDISIPERKNIAREVMRTAFEHVINRVILGLQLTSDNSAPLRRIVLAGGVAANSFFRHMLVTPSWLSYLH